MHTIESTSDDFVDNVHVHVIICLSLLHVVCHICTYE